MIQYRIPLQGIKVSTNKIYAGIHWSERKRIKDSILGYAAAFCRPIQAVKSYPVEIEYRFFFESRALDTLNTAYMAKMFEDAFRSLGILEEDSPKYVTRSILEVVAQPAKKRPKNDANKSAPTNAKDQDWVEVTINPYASTQPSDSEPERNTIPDVVPIKRRGKAKG